MTVVKLLLLISVLCPLSSESADRKFDESWDSSMGYSKTLPLRWGGGDSIDYTHRARYGTAPVVLTNAGQRVVWMVMGSGAARSNNYISSTGTVQATAGTVKFFVSPEGGNLTPGKYTGFVRTFTAAGSITNAVTLCYQDITVDWTPESAEYAVVTPKTNYYSAAEVDALFAGITGDVASVEGRVTSVEAYTNRAAEAHGWGNHAGLYPTIGTYAAATQSLWAAIGAATPGGYASVSNWAATAFGWGNHAGLYPTIGTYAAATQSLWEAIENFEATPGPQGPQGPAGTNDVDRIIALETGVVFRVDLDGSAYFPDWFQWSLSKISDEVADSTSVFTNQDRVIRRDVFNAVANDYLLSFQDQVGTNSFALAVTTSDSGVATAEVNRVYYVADGSADVTATVAGFSRTTNLIFGASGVTQDVTLAAVTGTVLCAITHGIDDLLLPGTTTSVYSVQNHAATNYVRNTNCWAAGLDLTCASPWNSYAAQYRAGALITSNILVTSQHWNLPVGTTVRFVTGSNTVVSRSVVSNVNLFTSPNYNDITVSKLSSPISEEEIRRAALMPDDLFSYFATETMKTPGFYIDQLEKALVEEASIFEQRHFSFVPSTATNRTDYTYPGIRNYDSSSPIFFNIDGFDRPILIGVAQGLGHTFFCTAAQSLILSAAASMGGSTNVVRPDLEALGFTNFLPGPPMPGGE